MEVASPLWKVASQGGQQKLPACDRWRQSVHEVDGSQQLARDGDEDGRETRRVPGHGQRDRCKKHKKTADESTEGARSHAESYHDMRRSFLTPFDSDDVYTSSGDPE